MGLTKELFDTFRKLSALESRTEDIAKTQCRIENKLDNILDMLSRLETKHESLRENIRNQILGELRGEIVRIEMLIKSASNKELKG